MYKHLKMRYGLNINNYTIAFVMLYLLAGVLACISPVLSILEIYMLTIYFVIRNDGKTFYYFIIFVFFQNIFLIFFANSFSSFETTIILLSKEIMLYGCFISWLLKKRMAKKVEYMFVAYLAVIGIAFFVSDASIYSKVVAVRQMLVPFICVYFGIHLSVTKEMLIKIEKLIIALCILVGLFGVFELLFLGDEFWKSLPLRQFNINKGTSFDTYMGMPLNFYTWDLFEYTGNVIRRMISFFADPLMSSGFFFTGLVLTDSYRIKYSKKYTVAEVFLLICGLLTLSKGFYVAVLVFYSMKIFKKLSYKKLKLLLVVFAFGVLALIILAKISLQYLPPSSITIHIQGLLSGIDNGSLIGNGLGKAGVMASQIGGIEESLAAESFMGVMIAQIGYIGLFSFLFIIGYILLKCLKYYCVTKEIRLYNYPVMVLAIVCQSFFSESSIGIVVTGTSFILFGLAYKVENYTCK